MTAQTWVVFGIPGALVAIASIVIVLICARYVALKRELRDEQGLLAALPAGGGSELGEAVRLHVVRVSDDSLAGRVVLTRSIRELRREYVESVLAHAWPFWVGSALTGLALICTFVLIAYVMHGDVSEAISNEADSTLLSSAVATLGGKFGISAGGVLGSLMTMFAANIARAKLHQLAGAPGTALTRAVISLDELRLRYQLDELESLRVDRAERQQQYAQVYRCLGSLEERARKLTSIEVSVQNIGNEVSANLRHIMKDAMAEELREILSTTMVQVDEIATSVQRTLSEAFSNNMTALATQLQASLTAVQRAVESQSQGAVEQLLGKLQDAVSGGFHSEQQKLSESLAAFAQIMPGLERQIGSLVDGLGAQQAASADAIARLQSAATQGAEAMARQLQASSEGVVTGVLSASRAEIEAIAARLEAMTSASAASQDEIAARVRDAMREVQHVTDGLGGAAKQLHALTGQLAGALADARHGSEATQVATRELASASTAVTGALVQLQDVVKRTSAQTEAQHALLTKQREYTKEVEQLWPQLFNVYLDKFRSSSAQLGESWKDLHDKVVQVTGAIGATFADNVEQLSAAVDTLARQSNGRARS